MSIDRLNSAAWAAGFAMAPTEDEAREAVAAQPVAEERERVVSGWRSAPVPSEQGVHGSMRQWLTGWQRKATA